MLFVRARAVQWLGAEPNPGVVEVMLADAQGKEWWFVDKEPIFGGDLRADSAYPVDVLIGCIEVGRVTFPDGDLVTISTAQPWGIETKDGTSVFEVRSDQLVRQ